MEPAQFAAVAPGQLVEATDALGNRGHAFVPNRIPPEEDFGVGARPLRLALSRADRALSRLDGIARQIARPDLLFRNYLRREAVLSSKIEGTHTTLADLVLYEAAHVPKPGGDDAVVANYLAAFDYARARCAEIPIGRQLFKEMHEILVEDTDVAKTTPGHFRDCLVVIGTPPMSSARFVPPPDLFVNDLLENLEGYLSNEDEPPLIKLAIAHYQFETIHPFRDGNGRLGRLLITLWLQREHILTEPTLYLSAYFERHQAEYYDRLLRVSTHGEWKEWIAFFLDGVETQSIDAALRTQRLVELRAQYHHMLTGPRVTQNLHRLVDELFKVPAISIPVARDFLQLSYPATKTLIERLVDADVLDRTVVTIKGTAYYVARGLLRALDAPIDEAATTLTAS
ncbi:MAG TPA: Fic/DOC family N-terminal domain-containing protein [Candidatus Elarobacter sp.]